MKREIQEKLCCLVLIIVLASFGSCSNGNSKGVAENKSAATNKSLQLRELKADFVSPITLVESPDGTDRLFVVDQVGKVFIFDASGKLLSKPFLDVSAKMLSLSPHYDERGLLGFAFHPDYKTNGKFYVYYSAPLKAGAPSGWSHTSRISEFTVSADPDKADPGSERVVLEINKPQANHNGGTIAFGKDGYLYISIGDGGNAYDVGFGHRSDWYAVNEGGNAQNIDVMLGKILRIDVNHGSPYGIPADNPFVGKPGLDEIYALGLRNPYRFSFDKATGELFAGDAGQNLYEEVDKITSGGNYGWNVKEGAHCFNAANPNKPFSSCPSSDPDARKLIDPIIEFQNINYFPDGLGTVVVGGNVYRGTSIPSLKGKYLFSNFTASPGSPSGDIYVATPSGSSWPYKKLNFSNAQASGIGYFVKGFGEDSKGELYVMGSKKLGPSGNTGRVLKIVEE